MCEVREVSACGMLSASSSAEFFCITLIQDVQTLDETSEIQKS